MKKADNKKNRRRTAMDRGNKVDIKEFCKGCGAKGGQSSDTCECCGACGSNNCHGMCIEEQNPLANPI